MAKLCLIALALFLHACGGHAGPFRMQPATALEPRPEAEPFFYTVPFEDRRTRTEIHRARIRYESVSVEAEGLSLTAAWQKRPYGGMALLWHRQWSQALAATEAGAAAAQDPVLDGTQALRLAGEAGARYLVSGRLEKLEIGKKGADQLVGTAFSGMHYPMELRARVRVKEVASGQVVLDKLWTYRRLFYDPTRMGAPDHQTFPSFFGVGLKDASEKLAGWDELRTAVNLPTYTRTPTPTATPLTEPSTPGSTPTPAPTPVPTPDEGPYWVNPKSGKRVDPAWNFDPEDGTPRKEFILRQPTPRPTPVRPTAPR